MQESPPKIQFTLVDLDEELKLLRACYPKKANMSDFPSTNIARIYTLRESIYLRILELYESIYDACNKDRVVTTKILARAAMETEALFYNFIYKLEAALQTKEIDDLNAFLTKALIGSRSPNQPEEKQSTNVLTLVDNVNKKTPGYRARYDFLSEFAHPNSLGVNVMYCRQDWENEEIVPGKNSGKFNVDQVVMYSVINLKFYAEQYNYTAELLNQFQLLENENASRQSTTNPEGLKSAKL